MGPTCFKLSGSAHERMHRNELLQFRQYGTMFENLLRCRNISLSQRPTSYNSNHDKTPCKLQISVTFQNCVPLCSYSGTSL